MKGSLSRRRFLAHGVFAATTMLGLPLIACAPAAPPTPTPAPQPAAQPTPTPAPAKPAQTPATPTPAPKPAVSTKEPVTITVATSWTGTGEKHIWDQLIATFEQKYPNIKIKLDLSSAEGPYDQKLFAQLAAGTLPDIVYTTDNYVVPFKQNGITRDMIPFARKTGFPYTDFEKTFLDLGMVEGELHMLPRGGDVVILFINKKLAAEAGVDKDIPWKLDPASDQWTKEDFLKICKRLTIDAKGRRGDEPGFDKKNVAIYGAAMPTSWWAVYVPAVLAEGGQFVAPDLSKSLLDSKEAVAAFEWLTRPVVEGYWASSSFLNTVGGAIGAFNSGKAAITATVRAAVPRIRGVIKDDWDVAHFYKGSAKRVTGMGTLGFALSATSKNPDAAWTFLEWMYSEEGMKIIASNYGSVPAQRRFYKASWWRELPPPPYNNDVFVDAFAYGTLPPRLPFYTTGPFRKAVEDGLQAVELGKMTPSEVVKSIHTELDKWLKEGRR